MSRKKPMRVCRLSCGFAAEASGTLYGIIRDDQSVTTLAESVQWSRGVEVRTHPLSLKILWANSFSKDT